MTTRADAWGTLIERSATGDSAALALLYDATVAQVHGLALRILGDRAAAEEVTGDVYLQVWRQAHRYDRARGAPLAWLLTLARSRAIDRLRAGAGRAARDAPAVHAAAESVDHEVDPEEGAVLAERRRLVQTALSALPAEQREVIELAYFGGLSQSEIAARLDVPLGTVKTRARLGMQRMRGALGDVGKAVL